MFLPSERRAIVSPFFTPSAWSPAPSAYTFSFTWAYVVAQEGFFAQQIVSIALLLAVPAFGWRHLGIRCVPRGAGSPGLLRVL